LTNTNEPIGVAVVGAGYWGPNLIRNLGNHPGFELRAVCDLDLDRAHKAVGRYSTVRVTSDLDEILDDTRIGAVAVATPPSTHLPVALACLGADKHVLIEKPLAPSTADARKLVDEAEARDLVLMCDHTFCYTPAVQRIREMIRQGVIGDVQYVDSVRINLGLIQPDINVFWDLAPHDLSILDFILPDDRRPVMVAAQGADPIAAGKECVGYLTLQLDGGAIAHAHVNWLSPTKIRTTIVGGSTHMLVWDDLQTSQKLSMFDRGVDLRADSLQGETREQALISYRVGDIIAPALPEIEALHAVAGEFEASIREHRAPLTDGHAGLRVLDILERADDSLASGGVAVPVSGEL
jgi:predicted dehydrogenase